MIKNFNEKERINMLEIFDSFQAVNGVVFSCGDIQRTVSFDIALANKIFNDEVKVKDMSEKSYDDMVFALEAIEETCNCAVGFEDPLVSKFLNLLKEYRNKNS